MIGNLELIIDQVAKDGSYDRRLVEVIAKETFKRWKTRIVHSENFTLKLPYFGSFVPMNSKLRRYVREYVRKVRRLRNKIKDIEKKISSCRDPERLPELEENLKHAKMFEGIALEKLKNALRQLNTLRTIWYEKRERKRERIEKGIKFVPGVSKISDFRIKKSKVSD